VQGEDGVQSGACKSAVCGGAARGRAGLEQVWTGRDDQLLGGHLGKQWVPYLACPSWGDYCSRCAAMTQFLDTVG
jgi:hypothetical protein